MPNSSDTITNLEEWFPRSGVVGPVSQAAGTTDYTVTFSPAFPSGVVPRVSATAVDINMDWVTVSAGSVTNTGMKVRVKNAFSSALSITAHWAATRA